MQINVRPATDHDGPAVRTVVTAAFGDEGQVAGLVDALRARADTQASLVAVDHEDRVVGYTHLSVSWVDAPARLIEVLTLSPLGVAPPHQSRGVGTTLLQRAKSAAAALGAPLVFLEGDPRYYSRHGWVAAGGLGFTAPSSRIPAAGFQVITLDGYEAETMRGALVYNDTFWSHDLVGLRD